MKLLDYQLPHFDRACQILAENFGYIDTAKTGSGKTYVAVALALKFGLNVFVIDISKASDKWNDLCKQNGIKIIKNTYNTLSGIKDKLSHPYLTRKTNTTGGKTNNVSYFPTDELIKLIDEGTLFIFDEAHKVKNVSTNNHQACRVIIETIIQRKGRSRYGLISATLIDRINFAAGLCMLTGYMLYPDSINLGPRDAKMFSLKLFIDNCSAVNPQATQKAIGSTNIIDDNYNKLCVSLLSEVITPRIRISYKAENNNPNFSKEVMTCFCTPSVPEEKELLKKAVDNFVKSTTYTKEGKVIIDTNALSNLELCKAKMFVRKAKEIILLNEKSKVVIFVNYVIPILNVIEQELAEFRVMSMFLHGEVPEKERKKVVNCFQNDPRYRIIISQVGVGGISIDLDDTKGDSPRYAIMSPGYSIISMQQALGRTNRADTKSKVTTYVVYSDDPRERKILDSAAAKEAVIKSLSPENVNEGGDFIGELDTISLTI